MKQRKVTKTKNNRKRINNALIAVFNNKEDEATVVFSSLLLPTNLIWAFFKRLDLDVSNKVVTTKKKAQIPTSGLVRWRMSIKKFTRPKSVIEKR